MDERDDAALEVSIDVCGCTVEPLSLGTLGMEESVLISEVS